MEPSVMWLFVSHHGHTYAITLVISVRFPCLNFVIEISDGLIVFEI